MTSELSIDISTIYGVGVFATYMLMVFASFDPLRNRDDAWIMLAICILWPVLLILTIYYFIKSYFTGERYDAHD